MDTIQINTVDFLMHLEIPIIASLKFIGVSVPRFCYHEKLSIASSCRICLILLASGPLKLIAACSSNILPTSIISTNMPIVRKGRENIVELLLINHPLDCPICDQGGDCDLQEQAKLFGVSHTKHYFVSKKVVSDKECGPLIKTIMTRCIHCTRCVRFASEIAGLDYLGALNRGGMMEIGIYLYNLFTSEVSGNVIALCPVGWRELCVKIIGYLRPIFNFIFTNWQMIWPMIIPMIEPFILRTGRWMSSFFINTQFYPWVQGRVVTLLQHPVVIWLKLVISANISTFLRQFRSYYYAAGSMGASTFGIVIAVYTVALMGGAGEAQTIMNLELVDLSRIMVDPESLKNQALCRFYDSGFSLGDHAHYLHELSQVENLKAKLLVKLNLDPQLTDSSVFKEAMAQHNSVCDQVAMDHLEHREKTIRITETRLVWLIVALLLTVGLVQAYFFYTSGLAFVGIRFIRGYKFALGIAGFLALGTEFVIACVIVLDSLGWDTGLIGQWVFHLGTTLKELYLSCGGTNYPEEFDTSKWDRPGQTLDAFLEEERLKAEAANAKAKLDPSFVKASESYKWNVETTTVVVRVLLFIVILGATGTVMGFLY